MGKVLRLGFCILMLGIPLAVRAGEGRGVSATRDPIPATPGTECWSMVSPYLEGTNAIEILLPKETDRGRRYPVVYCLPVNAGTSGEWGNPLGEAAKWGLADRYQAIFVAPSFPILPWYGNNSLNPLCRQNDHVIEAVLPFVGRHYPVNGTNYLIGFSKSALGALSLAMDHPDLFSGVAVFENWFGEPDAVQWERWGFKQCYGTRENYDLYDPAHLIARHSREWTNGPARITVLGGGPGLRPGVVQLAGVLTQEGIPHVEIWDRSMGHRWDTGWMPMAVGSLLSAYNPDCSDSISGKK